MKKATVLCGHIRCPVTVLALLLTCTLSATVTNAATATSGDSQAQDIVLVIDNSGSMRQLDRMSKIKSSLLTFVRRSNQGRRIGIMTFDDVARVASHLAPAGEAELEHFVAALNALDFTGRHTNIPLALGEAIVEFRSVGKKDAEKVIVLMTDGVIDTGDISQDAAGRKEVTSHFVDAAHEIGVEVYTIALGRNADSELLHYLARRTQGDYYWAANSDELGPVLEHIDQTLQATGSKSRHVAEPRPDQEAYGAPADAAESEVAKEVAQSAPPVSHRREDPAATGGKATDEPAIAGASLAHGDGGGEQEGADNQDEGGEDDRDEEGGVDFPTALMLLLAGLLAGLLLYSRRSGRGPKPLLTNFAGSARVPGDSPTRPGAAARAFLYDLSGVTGREKHNLDAPITVIGRVGPEPGARYGHITIAAPTIGRRHAVIEYKHYGFWLLDQNSKNGSFVNGERALREVCLSHGDRIQFHEYEFEFTLSGLGLADETTAAGAEFISGLAHRRAQSR